MPPIWMLWLLPMVIAPTLAVLWLSWRSRERGPVEAIETVQEHQRFKAALTTPLPPAPLPRPRNKPSRPVRPKEPTG